MRLGKVKISYEYVVDLDNESMVEQAKDALFEDISNSIKYEELGQIITTEETPNASENDIPDFLLEEDEWEREDHDIYGELSEEFDPYPSNQEKDEEEQFVDEIDDLEQDEILRTQG